jgi:uncharacterized membrane protein YfcA
MAAASAAGGWAGAGIARGIGQSRLRIAIIVTGVVVSLTLFYRLLR